MYLPSNRVLSTRPDVRSGLAAWWPLSDPAPNVVDLTGRGNNGQSVSGAPVNASGVHGQFATSFNHANPDVIFCGTGLFLQGPMSVSCWLNYTSIGTSLAGVIVAKSNGGTASFAVTQGEEGGGTNKINFWNNATGPLFSSTTSVTAGTWYHVVMVRNGSAGAWTFASYINGAADNTGSSATNPDGSSGQQVAISQFGSFAGHRYNGLLQNIRVYNRALSQAEANILYNVDWAPVELEPSIMQAAASGAVFRKSASALGTRTGSRQVWQ